MSNIIFYINKFNEEQKFINKYNFQFKFKL